MTARRAVSREKNTGFYAVVPWDPTKERQSVSVFLRELLVSMNHPDKVQAC